MHEDPPSIELMLAVDALDKCAQVLFAADARQDTKMNAGMCRCYTPSGRSTVDHRFACNPEGRIALSRDALSWTNSFTRCIS
jgi:hypothetical protein